MVRGQRDIKIARLWTLVEQNPDWGYRKVNAQLKVEFGSGLGTGAGRRLLTEITEARAFHNLPIPRQRRVRGRPRGYTGKVFDAREVLTASKTAKGRHLRGFGSARNRRDRGFRYKYYAHIKLNRTEVYSVGRRQATSVQYMTIDIGTFTPREFRTYVAAGSDFAKVNQDLVHYFGYRLDNAYTLLGYITAKAFKERA
mgnify:CR=1 FL=1|tara:strand:- start:2471 stop:3064 length:594 start_codon:yes stop_codon:yes gene_type:complete